MESCFDENEFRVAYSVSSITALIISLLEINEPCLPIDASLECSCIFLFLILTLM